MQESRNPMKNTVSEVDASKNSSCPNGQRLWKKYLFSFWLFPSGIATVNNLSPSHPTLCTLSFHTDLTSSFTPSINLNKTVPTSSSFYQYIHDHSSVHVQAISPKHLTCTIPLMFSFKIQREPQYFNICHLQQRLPEYHKMVLFLSTG